MDRLAQLEALVAVADLGSFTRAGRSLGVRQSTVSKTIAALEARLGATLLVRNAAGVRLTDEGQGFLQQARSILDAVTEAEGSLQPREGLQGILRISAPAAFGRLQLSARLARWLGRHPDLQVELTLSDHVRDLTREGLDVAIRLGPQPDSSLRARRIGATRRVLVAAPDYITQAGRPARTADLGAHAQVVFRPRFAELPWAFDTDEGRVELPVRGRFESDNAEACLEATIAGLGVSLLPSWMCEAALTDGRLEALLEDVRPRMLPIYALTPGQAFAPRRVRATVDYLAEEFRLDPTLTAYGVRID